jgi:hypothetical protein
MLFRRVRQLPDQSPATTPAHPVPIYEMGSEFDLAEKLRDRVDDVLLRFTRNLGIHRKR